MFLLGHKLELMIMICDTDALSVRSNLKNHKNTFYSQFLR